jgi:hypothetical protein
MEARILRPLTWFGLLEGRLESGSRDGGAASLPEDTLVRSLPKVQRADRRDDDTALAEARIRSHMSDHIVGRGTHKPCYQKREAERVPLDHSQAPVHINMGRGDLHALPLDLPLRRDEHKMRQGHAVCGIPLRLQIESPRLLGSPLPKKGKRK